MEPVIKVATIASLTYKTIKWAAQYTSIFATQARYNAVLSALNYWDAYFQSMTPAQIAQFDQEQRSQGAYANMRHHIELLKNDATYIGVELQRHSLITRCNPMSNVAAAAKNWDRRCSARIEDLEQSTTNLRRQQQQELQRASTEANAIRTGLDNLSNRVSNASLRGVLNGLRAVVQNPVPEQSAV